MTSGPTLGPLLPWLGPEGETAGPALGLRHQAGDDGLAGGDGREQHEGDEREHLGWSRAQQRLSCPVRPRSLYPAESVLRCPIRPTPDTGLRHRHSEDYLDIS